MRVGVVAVRANGGCEWSVLSLPLVLSPLGSSLYLSIKCRARARHVSFNMQSLSRFAAVQMAERGRGGREMQRPERERKDGRRGNYRAKRQDRGRKREGTCQCEAALKGRSVGSSSRLLHTQSHSVD